MGSWLFVAFVIVLHVTKCYGCTCYNPSPEFLYCPNDFVIRAMVLDSKGPYLPFYMDDIPDDEKNVFLDEYGYNMYFLEVLEEIRVSDFYNSNIVSMVINQGPTMCGVKLSNGTTYILTGSVVYTPEGFQLSTDACNLPTKIGPTDEIPKELKQLNCDNYENEWFATGRQRSPNARRETYGAFSQIKKREKLINVGQNEQKPVESPIHFDFLGKKGPANSRRTTV